MWPRHSNLVTETSYLLSCHGQWKSVFIHSRLNLQRRMQHLSIFIRFMFDVGLRTRNTRVWSCSTSQRNWHASWLCLWSRATPRPVNYFTRLHYSGVQTRRRVAVQSRNNNGTHVTRFKSLRWNQPSLLRLWNFSFGFHNLIQIVVWPKCFLWFFIVHGILQCFFRNKILRI
jgi:hypothetical protein